MSDQLIQGGLELTGRCLCEGVRYEIDGPLTDARNWHCPICRKAHSAAFRSRASVRAKDFRWIAGNPITWYDNARGTHRGFSSCDESPEVCLSLGCLDMDPGVRPEMPIPDRSMAPWFEITGALQRYDEGPPR